MPMECLRKIAHQKLPHHVFEQADIEKLRVLRAAGLINAYIPSPGEDRMRSGMVHTPATVFTITAKGKLALQVSPQELGL